MAKQKGLTAMSDSLRAKRMAQCKQVNQLRKNEKLLVKDACAKVGISQPTYNYFENSVRGRLKSAPKKRKKLTVTEVPMFETSYPLGSVKTGTGFMIFGTPAYLANFARSYEQA